MSTQLDERLSVLHADALLDCQLSVAVAHAGEDAAAWRTSSASRVSVLDLTEDAPIVGRQIVPSEPSSATSNWTLLELCPTPSLLSRVEATLPPKSSGLAETSGQHKIATLVLAVPRSKATLPHSGISLMKALASKYMSSQELKDARYGEMDSLASSGSSWTSGTSTTVDQDGVQVIGAMGGKSIEFHKPRTKEEEFGAMTIHSTVCQHHPHISLHNSNLYSFADDSFVRLSLVGLKSLDLSANFLRSFSRDITPLLSSTTNSLETLNLSSNPLAPLDADLEHIKPEIVSYYSAIASWLSQASQDTLHIFARYEANGSPSSAELAPEPSLNTIANRLFPARSLSTIVLNKTFIPWSSFVMIASALPSLVEAHVCFNGWTSLAPEEIVVSGRRLASQSLRILNLDGNGLSDFASLARALEGFTALHKLVLASNPISHIPALQLSAGHPFSRPRVDDPSANHWSLSITSTHIVDWTSVRNLARMFPDLQELRFQRNPMQTLSYELPSSSTLSEANATDTVQIAKPTTAQVSDQVVRQYVVALCPHVTLVNGSKIGLVERKDAERLYLVHYFTSFTTPELRKKHKEHAQAIEELGATDEAIARLWNAEKDNCLEAFARAHPSTTSATSSASGAPAGIVLMDITVCDESAEFMMSKKLPASTSIAKLRSLVADAVAVSSVAERFANFTLELMEPSFQGPPSFLPLTLEQSTLAQETSRLKVSVILRPKV